VIAHSPEVITRANRIVRLERGRLVDDTPIGAVR
jgi:ABC-type multidrug transport system fused ATPase/permease subunit